MTAIQLSDKYSDLLERNGINTPLRLAHFFAQVDHESGLKPVSENLNYSASALRRVFGKYFPNDTIANEYARQPEKIANRVYANRMENDDEASGDGWRYRGRGYIQITGKANYKELSNDTGKDYVSNPELLLTEEGSITSAVWYWSKRGLNKYADVDDIKAVTYRINGGYNGIDHREDLLNNYKVVFGVI